MQIHVTFRHMPSSEALKNYVESKIERFSKFLHEPIDIHVVLEVEKIRQLAKITLNAKNFQCHEEGESSNMYATLDVLLDRVERQLIKHKEIVKDHKTHAHPHL